MKSLPETEKTSHRAKLTLSDGFAPQDSFAIEKWSENRLKILKLNYPDIYSYLIDTPSEFTKEKNEVLDVARSMQLLYLWTCPGYLFS